MADAVWLLSKSHFFFIYVDFSPNSDNQSVISYTLIM